VPAAELPEREEDIPSGAGGQPAGLPEDNGPDVQAVIGDRSADHQPEGVPPRDPDEPAAADRGGFDRVRIPWHRTRQYQDY
jgi:hypothetical protein